MAEDWLNPYYEQDLVSVIIPCYNQARFLPACLESVTEQEYRPIEVIIVDDGSSDGTKRIMEDFQSSQKEGLAVRCFYQSNHGAQHARNRACRQARGEFFQFLDSDDVLCRNKLAEQIIVFRNNSEVDVVYGEGQYLIDFGETARKGAVISIGSSSDIVESLIRGYWVPPFSYLSRRSAVQRCGPWDIALPVLQDFEYFLRMAIMGSRFRHKAGINGFYRKHSFGTISEQSVKRSSGMALKILAQAEHRLREQGIFNEKRGRAMAENFRWIARQAYSVDIESFKNALDNVLRLCPRYLPAKRRARFISLIIGFRNYEKVAAMISRRINKNKEDWV